MLILLSYIKERASQQKANNSNTNEMNDNMCPGNTPNAMGIRYNNSETTCAAYTEIATPVHGMFSHGGEGGNV